MKFWYQLYSRLRSLHSALPYLLGNGWALPPVRVTIELTYRCNLRCEMCYLSLQELARTEAKARTKKLELTTGEVKNLLRHLPRFSLVTFTGGEPLLRQDFLELLQFAGQKHKTTVISNGYFIDPATADKIIDARPAVVAISVDGLERIHDQIRQVAGSFAKARQALIYLRQSRQKKNARLPLLELKTVITERNAGQLAEIYSLAEQLSVDSFTVQIFSTSANMNALFLSAEPTFWQKPGPIKNFPTDVLKKQLELCLEQAAKSAVNFRIIPNLPLTEIIKHYENKLDLRDYSCHWPWSVGRVSPYGDVYPCYNYPVGNIREQSFRRIWNGPLYQKFRRDLKRHKIYPGCIGCCVLEYHPPA